METPLTPTTAVAYVDLAAKPQTDDLAVQNSMSDWRVSRLTILLIASFLITFMSGGLILGFGPLYTLLVDEGQWKELCAAGEELTGVTCARQEVWLQYIFSTAFLCLSLANAVFGFLSDIIGPRLCVLIGFVITFIGNIMLAYGESTVGKGVSIIVGYSCLGIGGYSVYICSFQFVQLFDHPGFVTSTISGLFNASGYVFMLLHIHGMTRKGFFLFYAVFSTVCMLVAWVAFPLRSNSEVSKQYTLSGFKWRTPRFVLLTRVRPYLPAPQYPNAMWPTLKQQFKRPDLWFFGVFFGWISTWFAFAGGAIPNIIYKLAGDDGSTADLYVNYLVPLIGNSSFVFTPLVGMVIHKYGFRISFGITAVLVHFFIGFLKINSLYVQIITLLWYSLSQAFFYSLQFAYIIVCFPAEVYGSLQCFLALCSFFMGLLNYAFNPWTQNTLHGNYTDIFIVFAAPVLLFYCFLGLIHKGVKTPDEEKEAAEKEADKLSVA